MAALVRQMLSYPRLIATQFLRVRTACEARGVLDSNSDLEVHTTTQPSSPASGVGSAPGAVQQLLDHGTGSGVKKAGTDRWARSRAKAARTDAA